MGTKLKLIGLALTLVAGTALAQTKPAARNWNTTVTVTPQGTHVLGNPAAKIRLTQYVSYTCPHCAHFEEQADAQLRLTFVATGKGAVEVRNIIRDPIDLTVALLTNCGPTAKFFGNHAAFLRGQDKWIGPLVNPSPAQRARWTTGAFATRTGRSPRTSTSIRSWPAAATLRARSMPASPTRRWPSASPPPATTPPTSNT